MTGIGMAVSVVLAALAGLLLAGLLNNKRMYENEAQALHDERARRFIDRCDAARVRCERDELRERCKHLQETVRRCHDALEARRAQVDHLHREHREVLDALNEVDEDRARLLEECHRIDASAREGQRDGYVGVDPARADGDATVRITASRCAYCGRVVCDGSCRRSVRGT